MELASAPVERFVASLARTGQSSWASRLQERAKGVEKSYNQWRKARAETDKFHRENPDVQVRGVGGKSAAVGSRGSAGSPTGASTFERLQAREMDARAAARAAEKGVEDLLALAARWVQAVDETYQWVLDAPLEDMRWEVAHLAALLRKVSGGEGVVGR